MDTYEANDVTLHRAKVGAGRVAVIVRRHGIGAEVEVYDERALRPAYGMSDEEFAVAPETVAARNRFGVAAILRLLREVRVLHPEVCWWGWTRKTGTRVGRRGYAV